MATDDPIIDPAKGQLGPFRRAILRGLAVLLPPLLTVVIFIWVWNTLRDGELPNLWVPARDAFHEVAEIPILGSGKLDLRKVRELALDCADAADRLWQASHRRGCLDRKSASAAPYPAAGA